MSKSSSLRQLVDLWFLCWKEGDYMNLPLHESFVHVSPYGSIEGKDQYLQIVKDNESLFVDNELSLHEQLFSEECACVRYTMKSPSSEMEVSEWFYPQDGLIKKIVAYYDTAIEKKGGRGLDL